MNRIRICLRQCTNCFNQISLINDNNVELTNNSYRNIFNLTKNCLHKKEFICYDCFLKIFHYDRFIIRYLFIYLSNKQTNYVHIKDFYLLAQYIINLNEFNNYIEFLSLLFHVILSDREISSQLLLLNDDLLEKLSIDSFLFYKLINDAFFFTAIQANVQTDLTNSSQVRRFF